MGYNLPISGIDWGYNPLSNLLLTPWDIQVGVEVGGEVWRCFFDWRRPGLKVVELGGNFSEKKWPAVGKCFFMGSSTKQKEKVVVKYKG